MHCQSLCVLSNVCTVFVEKDQRQLAMGHVAEMQKLRDELTETKILLECIRKVLDETDKEALFWQDRHPQLVAIVQKASKQALGCDIQLGWSFSKWLYHL